MECCLGGTYHALDTGVFVRGPAAYATCFNGEGAFGVYPSAAVFWYLALPIGVRLGGVEDPSLEPPRVVREEDEDEAGAEAGGVREGGAGTLRVGTGAAREDWRDDDFDEWLPLLSDLLECADWRRASRWRLAFSSSSTTYGLFLEPSGAVGCWLSVVSS